MMLDHEAKIKHQEKNEGALLKKAPIFFILKISIILFGQEILPKLHPCQ
jgi:hypothetical protein